MQLKKWFFEITKTALKLGTRFRNADRPDQNTFEELLDSSIFKTEANDRAKEDVGTFKSENNGHVTLANSQQVHDLEPQKTDRTLVVGPDNLPVIAAGTNVTVTVNTDGKNTVYTISSTGGGSGGDSNIYKGAFNPDLPYVTGDAINQDLGIYELTLVVGLPGDGTPFNAGDWKLIGSTKASDTSYVQLTAGDWLFDPTFVKPALDELAARAKSLETDVTTLDVAVTNLATRTTDLENATYTQVTRERLYINSDDTVSGPISFDGYVDINALSEKITGNLDFAFYETSYDGENFSTVGGTDTIADLIAWIISENITTELWYVRAYGTYTGSGLAEISFTHSKVL